MCSQNYVSQVCYARKPHAVLKWLNVLWHNQNENQIYCPKDSRVRDYVADSQTTDHHGRLSKHTHTHIYIQHLYNMFTNNILCSNDDKTLCNRFILSAHS